MKKIIELPLTSDREKDEIYFCKLFGYPRIWDGYRGFKCIHNKDVKICEICKNLPKCIKKDPKAIKEYMDDNNLMWIDESGNI